MRFKAILLAAVPLIGFSQTATQSPLSISGIGEPVLVHTAWQNAMGKAGIAVVSTSQINTTNPASYADLRWPTFGTDLQYENLQVNGSSSGNLSFQNFSFGFPLILDQRRQRRAGFAFGLQPQTAVGYDFTQRQQHPDLGVVNYSFSGTGGVNNAHFGASADLLANRDSGEINALSLGISAAYVFGHINKTRYTEFDPDLSASNLYRTDGAELSGVNFQGGLLYKKKVVFESSKEGRHRLILGAKGIARNSLRPNALRDNDRYGIFSLGLSVKPASHIPTFVSRIEHTYIDSVPNATGIDTLVNSEMKIDYKMPLQYAAGIGFNYNNQLSFAADYSYQAWSQATVLPGGGLVADYHKISFGVELIPKPDAYREFIKTVRYRAGVFAESGIAISGSTSSRLGIGFGLGIPLTASRSGSMVHFSTNYSSGNAGNYSEQSLRFQFGITIAPNLLADQWFVRKKYD